MDEDVPERKFPFSLLNINMVNKRVRWGGGHLKNKKVPTTIGLEQVGLPEFCSNSKDV